MQDYELKLDLSRGSIVLYPVGKQWNRCLSFFDCGVLLNFGEKGGSYLESSSPSKGLSCKPFFLGLVNPPPQVVMSLPHCRRCKYPSILCGRFSKKKLITWSGFLFLDKWSGFKGGARFYWAFLLHSL